MQRSKTNNILIFIASIVICQLAGIIGSIFTTPAIPTWYANINKPTFRPPNWVFAPVWTTLFLLMGIALFLIWKKGLDKKENRIAFSIFIFQLILNTLWSVLFFGMKSPFAAFMEIIFLWVAILTSIILFFRISRLAGALLIPYILWVSFASILNFSIWKINI